MQKNVKGTLAVCLLVAFVSTGCGSIEDEGKVGHSNISDPRDPDDSVANESATANDDGLEAVPADDEPLDLAAANLPDGENAEAQSAAHCGRWSTGTMTGYNNGSADDSHPGSFMEYTHINRDFLDHVPVIAIHEEDWRRFRYHNVQIRFGGKVATVQSWDGCADSDCDGCCTKNKRKFARPGFLMDLEARSAKRLFGIKNAEDHLFTKVQFRICDAFDPQPIARRYGAHK